MADDGKYFFRSERRIHKRDVLLNGQLFKPAAPDHDTLFVFIHEWCWSCRTAQPFFLQFGFYFQEIHFVE